jgi:Na+/melibiose symporter-like transporter
MRFIITILFVIVCIVAWFLRPRKNMSKSRKYAILSVTLLSLVLACAAVVYQSLQNATGKFVSDVSVTLSIIGYILICAAMLSSAGSAIAHKGEVAQGIGFGICIAVVISIIELGLLQWMVGLPIYITQ